MELKIAPEDGERRDEAVDELLGVEPYLAYSNFPPIADREGAILQLYRGHWRAPDAGSGVLVAREGAGRPVAALRYLHREFESQHFDMPMARIEPPIGVGDEAVRIEAARSLYAAARELMRERGYAHVTAQVSSRDRAACWAVQEAGGFHVGMKISWMAELTGARHEPRIAPNLRIETYEGDAIAALPPASWQRLAEWCTEGFRSNALALDLALPTMRAREVYRVWTEKAMTGEWADAVLVVLDGDEIVAHHTMRIMDDLSEAAGARVLGRGIGGTLPGYRGLFTALQREVIARRPLGASFLENETQASTIESIRVFGKLGHPCLRSTAAFNLRLDGAR